MTELLGQSFLGSTFTQDPKNEYIKIDGVVLGESPKYGYKTIKSDDIGKILDDCINDKNSSVILYNWEEKVAYVKSGFDLSLEGDSKVKPGFTTFIEKKRISKKNKLYFKDTPVQEPVSEPTPQPTPAPNPEPSNPTPANPTPSNPTPGLPVRVNEYVRLGESDKSRLELNGRPFVPVGWNAFFMGLMQETMRHPTKAQITEVFEAARKMQVRVIRSHTLGFSASADFALLDWNNNFREGSWDIIDFAFAEAKRCSVKLILPLTDPYEYYHGSYKTFCDPHGVPKDQFFTNRKSIDEFKKYITAYLNHINKYTKVAIKDALEVAFLELGNELGNIRPNAGSTAIPTRDWIVEITKHIKSIDKNHLVLNGSDECLGSNQSNDFTVLEIDCFQSHFYWMDWNRIKTDAKRSLDAKRPYFIGEFDSKWGNDWYKGIEVIPNMQGSLSWSIYPHEDGKPTGKRIQHDDGFTFWFDAQSGDNTKYLLNMTNHFRRMQKMSEVNSIKL
ncbi:MAG: PT domain-containing protein [Cetobacterium sp.]